MDSAPVQYLNPRGPSTPYPPHYLNPGRAPGWVNPGWSGSGRWSTPSPDHPPQTLTSEYQPAQREPPNQPPASVAAKRRQPWATRSDWRMGAVVVVLLAAVGALLGILWQAWSPAGPLGLVVRPGAIQPDETEAFIAGDGRFAAIALVVGLIAGIGLWLVRPTRGPIAVLALAIGGLLGAYLMAVVGYLVRGGSESGKAGTLLQHVPLRLHSHGLLVVEAAVAVLGYVVCAAFAERDDLGRSEDQPAPPVGSSPYPVEPRS